MHAKRIFRCGFLALLMLAIPASSFAGVLISVNLAPPALPVYTQPPCPGDGYMWTPGYWAWGANGYYWVPGTWVMAPQPGLLWTPGYWGWGGGVYLWHPGYWGPHVGFYGGVNYGFGYIGVGFAGGEWRGGHFFYNRSVTNINIVNVHVYNRVVVNNVHVTHVSFNGGPGGIVARPTHTEEMAMNEHHFGATRTQISHENSARGNRDFLASVNHGRPAVAATARPGEFRGRDAVAARSAGGPYRPENRPIDNHATNRNVPRPQSSPRNMDRPQASTASAQRKGNVPRPDAQNRPSEHPTSYHPGGGGHQNSEHDNASRPHDDKEHERGR
jgi:WXXGXW repeat (2 copies)